MSRFTCNSCGLAFETIAGQHGHMKSEWHRYNLKRRVAELPPITEADFNSKVTALKLMEEEERARDRKPVTKGRKGGKAEEDVERTVTKKEQRRKEKEAIAEKRKALLEQARQAMKNSQRAEAAVVLEGVQELLPVEKLANDVEKLTVAPEPEKQDEPIELTEEQLMEEKLKNYEKIPENACLFTGKLFDTFEDALTHMFKNYGFFIPEQKYLVDKKGLVAYLAEKIALGNVCLCCKYQGRSLEAVRSHMISKRHCKIPYETENEKLEISEFYDFTSTYDDVPVESKAEQAGDEDEWEDVSGDEDDVESEDEDLPQELSYNTGYELHLPSGAVVGHRSLMRYYRQNVLPEKVLSEGQGTVIAAEARRMAKVHDKKELALQKRVWKREYKANDINDRRAAKFVNNQPHYRDQLLQ